MERERAYKNLNATTAWATKFKVIKSDIEKSIDPGIRCVFYFVAHELSVEKHVFQCTFLCKMVICYLARAALPMLFKVSFKHWLSYRCLDFRRNGFCCCSFVKCQQNKKESEPNNDGLFSSLSCSANNGSDGQTFGGLNLASLGYFLSWRLKFNTFLGVK